MCKNWYVIFFSPRIWRTLEITETTFTYRKYNIFGYELLLSHERVQLYLTRVGEYTRRIVVHPTFNFHNLYEFYTILAAFLEFFQEYPMPHLEVFEFTFACESRIPVVGPVVLGTGGQFLEKLTHLLGVMKNLKRLVLNYLLLESTDVPGVLEQVVKNCCTSLLYFELRDFSKEKCPLFQVGMLHGLRKLVITPHNVTDDVMLMLANNTALEELVLVQDKYTAESDPVSPRTWKTVRNLMPWLKVRLQVSGLTRSRVLLQDKAPVWCIMHETPYARINTPEMYRIIDNYRNTLRVFGHLMLPRIHGARTFHCRADSGLVALARHCPHITKLYIRERISTATLLIIVTEGKSLKELYVRRNAVILKADWPKPIHWEQWRYEWLCKTARSYDRVEQAVSVMLKQNWSMLSDARFKQLRMDF